MLALLTVLSLALECYIAVVAAVTHTRKKKTPVELSYHCWGEGGIVCVTLQLLTSSCEKTLRQQRMLLPHLAVKTSECRHGEIVETGTQNPQKRRIKWPQSAARIGEEGNKE